MKIYKNKDFIFSILIIVLTGISIALMFNSFYLVEDSIIMDTDVNIDYSGNVTGGFNLDADAVHFGIVGNNGQSFRTLDFENGYDRPVTYTFNVFGDISPGIRYKVDGEFYKGSITVPLAADETKKISFYFDATDKEAFPESGFYTGQIQIIVKKDLFSII